MPYVKEREIASGKGPEVAGILCLLLVLIFLVCLPPAARATVEGRCEDCHAMHSEDPSPALTVGGCLECHAMDPDGTNNIVVIGQSRVPQVLHHMENGDLAAGNFYYVADSYNPDYGRGHNLVGISQQEPPPMDVPPGFIGSVMLPGGQGPLRWLDRQELTCAGTWGCHGDRTIEDPYEAIYGAHHEDDSEIDGTTVGKSYRFLYGIKGAEHEDWEYLATISNHNGYKGDPNRKMMDTISYLCGECHGQFHPNPFLGGMEVGGMDLWHRHPTDVAFGDVHTGYVGSEYESYIIYSLEAPVAFDDPTGREDTVDGNSIIMCLSCHRAHASPYQDILRWDYTDMIAGDVPGKRNGGCFTCHVKK
jgi:hypothetical protein